jgi:hypothetical protein
MQGNLDRRVEDFCCIVIASLSHEGYKPPNGRRFTCAVKRSGAASDASAG